VIRAAGSSASEPLNALIWVFGVIGGLTFLLMLVTMMLAFIHKRRRDHGRYRSALSRLRTSVREGKPDKTWLGQAEKSAANNSTLAEEGRASPWNSIRALTTGDLVMDPEMRQSALDVAQELRRRKRHKNGQV
jgi:hypothetical protein